MLCKKKKKKKKKKTEKGRCYGAQCIMGRTIKIAVVFTQHGVGLVRCASGGLTILQPFRFTVASESLFSKKKCTATHDFLFVTPVALAKVCFSHIHVVIICMKYLCIRRHHPSNYQFLTSVVLSHLLIFIVCCNYR